jgi:hypothetical protein
LTTFVILQGASVRGAVMHKPSFGDVSASRLCPNANIEREIINFMKFEQLKLPSGARMKLTIANVGKTPTVVQSRFVGFHAGRSIIAVVPTSALTNGLSVGAKVAVSLVTPTDIATFTSSIEAVAKHPFAHLFLHYPDALNVRKVRSAARVSVGVSAQVANLGGEDPLEMHEAQILDMSVSGLRLVAKEALGRIGDELSVHVQLGFDDINRKIMLTGNIRSESEAAEFENEGSRTYGVEFSPMADDKRVWLYAFVFCMIQRQGPQM